MSTSVLNIILFIAVSVISILFFLYVRKKNVLEKELQEKTKELLSEKERTDKLLANVLPKSAADELRTKGRATSKIFDFVTVLFCDIEGFTKIAEQLNPEVLVDRLDSYYFHFDTVVEKNNIEKIKTIGDAYMCVGGLPKSNRTNPVEVILVALEMLEYIKNLKKVQSTIWDLRIGIHTGTVIGGVIGQKRLTFDIWGDTVNTASRMESSGESGRINISGQTYKYAKDFFICEYRGKMPVKYKGNVDMYFVNGIRPELSEDSLFKPNDRFYLKLQFVRIQDLEKEVFEFIDKNFPEYLTYHTLKHTIDLYSKTELYARAENLEKTEMLILITAALVHDIYYYEKKVNKEGTLSINKMLMDYKYNQKQINDILNLINSVNDPLDAQSLSQKIIIDAEYDFFGRADFMSVLRKKFDELQHFDSDLTWEKWLNSQSPFYKEYDFYLSTARRLREISKEKQLKLFENKLNPSLS